MTLHRSPRALPLAILVILVACADGSLSPGASSTPSSTATSTTPPPTSTPSITEAVTTSSPSESATPEPTAVADALLATTLTDVRSGESFTLAELAAEEGPVLLEPMAIWCSNCRAQQREVVTAHDGGTFASVSLDVDLSEAAADLAVYADREGFDWRFAMADAELYQLLRERFGNAAVNPPSTPLIVIARDGTVRPLTFGVGTRSAQQLLDELGAG